MSNLKSNCTNWTKPGDRKNFLKRHMLNRMNVFNTRIELELQIMMIHRMVLYRLDVQIGKVFFDTNKELKRHMATHRIFRYVGQRRMYKLDKVN
jgi:hypothetical protein